MTILRLVGVGLICATLAACLRPRQAPLASWLLIGASVVLIGQTLADAGEIFAFLRDFTDAVPTSSRDLLFRASGIALVGSFGAGACRELGAADVADKLTFAARVAILLVCLPLAREVVDTARTLLA